MSLPPLLDQTRELLLTGCTVFILRKLDDIQSEIAPILSAASAYLLMSSFMRGSRTGWKGHVGFYCGGMNKEAQITVHGHAGVQVSLEPIPITRQECAKFKISFICA